MKKKIGRNKRVRIFLLCMMFILLIPITCVAHPGRTDSQGGHHDYKNKSGLGSYHYHHGMGPHLHPGGVCPYGGANVTIPSDSDTAYKSEESNSQTAPGGTTEAVPNTAKDVPKRPKINLSDPPTTLNVGEKKELSINTQNTGISALRVSSSNDSVIRVEDTKLYAEGAGSAIINIKCGNAETSFEVNVREVEIEELNFSNEEIKVQLNHCVTARPNIYPMNATKKELRYTSEDENIATVKDGEIYGNAVGETEIQAEAMNGITAKLKVKVYEVFPEKIETNSENIKLEMGDSFSLDIKILPENANNKKYTTEVKNSEVATIDLDQVVTSVNDGETELVIKTDNELIKKIPIQVYHIPVEHIDIIDSKIDYIFSNIVSDKSSIILSSKIGPQNATFQDTEWLSSNDNTIQVKGDKFVINGVGKVTLSVNTYDNVQDSITIIIVNIPTIIISVVVILLVGITICAIVYANKGTSLRK